MSANWPSVNLGDYCTKIGSGATPRGGASVYLDKGDICLIRSQNIYNEGFKPGGLVFITEESAQKLKNVIVEESDVLLNITGDSVARVCLAKKEFLPARVNQHVMIIRPDPNEFDSRYIRYLLASPQMQNLLLSIAAVGATRNALTKNMIETLEVSKPPISIQVKIANHLELLERKIELNQNSNQTLEAIAQALFKSWFVDFDPVKAKIATLESGGSTEDAELAAMSVIASKSLGELRWLKQSKPDDYIKLAQAASAFPFAMTDSDIGAVPEGWEVKSLDEIAHYQNGLALQKFRPSGSDSLPVLKIAQLKKGIADGEEKASPDIKPECIVFDGDVVFSWSGSLMVDTWCGGKVALNQHLFKVTSKDYPKWFYNYFTKHHLLEFQHIAESKAVTMGHIKREHLTQARCAVPDEAIIKLGDNSIGVLLNKQIEQRLENNTLTDLRNALLPRLLSGEIEAK